ncbi:MAG: electron transfer flavoprotein beta subunit/FixA family protein [Ancrocorticia sp.]|jgi:electron transfer flavoprotein beta subunit|nr:electron transfer flavoprotein beta subunit/FixA family protein [Ancrocorticia sp.]MCI1896647.1 electron transfer flavoprotein beta subunit/FixA family protein [Ancrocorticia sp.]MCI1933287.1 electron transfer flavoprotein beta subunit/FixA family protein [Ancrocorticia sp.]MCI1963130.1 electron transfer flavoprotein beta subunit/FixA family protein [Ancrocorticia sp.]MCI2001498.1 electron transfer flavoprotein beta subunit/FixA family protein [Ancrocorticia sp.]
MSCVVAFKWTFNPHDAVVGPDGSIDWSRAKPALSDYDGVAIAYAVSLAQACGGSAVGVSVGTAAVGTSLAKKSVLSRGLDKAVVVADDATAAWNPTEVGAALGELVKHVADARLVITGDSSVDEGAKLMPALIAGALGWPCFEDVSAISVEGEHTTLRQSSRTITVTGPLVVSVTPDAMAVKVPGMKDILQAGKKPLEIVQLAGTGAEAGAANLLGREKPQQAVRSAQIFEGDDAVSHVVAVLREQGLV